jgi:hypothetical protein
MEIFDNEIFDREIFDCGIDVLIVKAFELSLMMTWEADFER